MSVQIIRGDARSLPLADNSVDLLCTSPPYFGLRSYQDNGEHYPGQLGDEATPAEFVDALIACTAEWMRVLKPSGSMWVNLGDKYAAHQTGHKPNETAHDADGRVTTYQRGAGQWKHETIRPKSLIGIPWRYALRCIDDLGLILRAEVIWSKPNGLPESVTDRVRRSHEQWFHFTLEPRYFSAVDEIREAHIGGYSGLAATFKRDHAPRPGSVGAPDQHRADRADMPAAHSLGKLPGSVWTIPTEPLRVPESLGIDHFAAFPTEWPRRIIQGWSPSGVCVECGEGRRPVTHRKPMEWRPGPSAGSYDAPGTSRVTVSGTMLAAAETTITGYACACPPCPYHHTVSTAACELCSPPTRPAVVLDPFGGSGTTALVAHALGRHGISNDMSADYCRLAAWRTSDPGQIAKVRGERKPVEQIAGQEDLFGEVSA